MSRTTGWIQVVSTVGDFQTRKGELNVSDQRPVSWADTDQPGMESVKIISRVDLAVIPVIRVEKIKCVTPVENGGCLLVKLLAGEHEAHQATKDLSCTPDGLKHLMDSW